MASGHVLYDAGSSNLVLCDSGRGGEGVEGKFKREGIHVHLWLTHIDVW